MKDHASNFTPFQIASQWHVLKWQEWKIQQGEDQLIHKFKAEMCSTTNSWRHLANTDEHSSLHKKP